MKEFAAEVLTIISENIQLEKEICELFALCKDEIEEGGSEDHEIELCRNAIQELIDEKNEAG